MLSLIHLALLFHLYLNQANKISCQGGLLIVKLRYPFIVRIILIPLIIVLILGCAQSDGNLAENKAESVEPQETNVQSNPSDQPEELPDVPIIGQPQNSESEKLNKEKEVLVKDNGISEEESIKRVTLKMNKENIILVEKSLNKAGFYPNTFEGVLDDQLKEAIISFQNYTGLNPDGIVDLDMIKYLDIYSGGCESAYALKINISK